MDSVTIMAMVVIGVCCIMLATQPSRGGVNRRNRRERPKPKDDQQPDQSRTAQSDEYDAPVHRNRWSRPDLARAFGRDLDTPDPAASAWPRSVRGWW